MFFEIPDWNLGKPAQENDKNKGAAASKNKRKKEGREKESETRRQNVKIDRGKPPDNTPSAIPKKKGEVIIKGDKNLPVPPPTKKDALSLKLGGARFRYLNQKLYESDSNNALKYFQENPEDFIHYHEGFKGQTKSWPVNPVDIFINKLESDSSENGRSILTVADIGCGEAKLAQTFFKHKTIKVHSFDLCAANEHVTVANMTNLPPKDEAVDITLFCLSLMNTDYEKALSEANRILKKQGKLWIAEVASRFDGSSGLKLFEKSLQEKGFKILETDDTNSVFIILIAEKVGKGKDSVSKKKPVLKPCLYKKR